MALLAAWRSWRSRIAGWLRLPFWPCVGYMAVGKFLRYLVYTTALVWLWPHLQPWLRSHGH